MRTIAVIAESKSEGGQLTSFGEVVETRHFRIAEALQIFGVPEITGFGEVVETRRFRIVEALEISARLKLASFGQLVQKDGFRGRLKIERTVKPLHSNGFSA